MEESVAKKIQKAFKQYTGWRSESEENTYMWYFQLCSWSSPPKNKASKSSKQQFRWSNGTALPAGRTISGDGQAAGPLLRFFGDPQIDPKHSGTAIYAYLDPSNHPWPWSVWG